MFAGLIFLLLPEDVPPVCTDTLIYDYDNYIYQMSIKRFICLPGVWIYNEKLLGKKK